MCPSGTSALSNFGKSFGILSSPYLFKNIDDVKNILYGEWGDELLATLDGTGFLGLGYGLLGFTNMSNNVRPIVKASDLEGLKIRCVANPLLLNSYKAIGASPVAMSFNELFSAMQQGVVDGQFNPMTTILSSNFQEVQKYISKTSDITSIVVFIVDEGAFTSLKPEYQRIIKDGIRIATDYMLESVVVEEAEAEKKLLASGKVQINEVSDSVKKELFQKAYPAIEAYGNSINPELFSALKNELGLN
ncbi:Solute-binding protein [bioreactor metagenome]|uniref:Solute-binding protein n=1 Tax=bioreactor metagenome TaxID=1076179 RepID=A0A645DG24_9ZZZZ